MLHQNFENLTYEIILIKCDQRRNRVEPLQDLLVISTANEPWILYITLSDDFLAYTATYWGNMTIEVFVYH